MVSISACLRPAGSGTIADHATQISGFDKYAIKHWPEHILDLCCAQHPEESIAHILSRLCSKWKLDHTYARPLLKANSDASEPQSSFAFHSCPLVDRLVNHHLLDLFWFLHQPHEAYGGEALRQASQEGDVALVQHLVQDTVHVNVNARDNDDWTALMHASLGGHLEIAQTFLADSRIDPNAVDENGWTPLMFAATAGRLPLVKAFLADERVDVSLQDETGWSAVMHAVAAGHLNLVPAFLAAERVDLNAQDRCGMTPLALAASNGHAEVVKALLADSRTDVRVLSQGAWMVLMYAACHGDFPTVEALLAEGRVDVGAQQEDGWTALMYAASNGEADIVKALLARGADPNTRCREGSTAIIQSFISALYPPMRWASETIPARRKGCFECIDLLLAQPGIDLKEFERIQPVETEVYIPLN